METCQATRSAPSKGGAPWTCGLPWEGPVDADVSSVFGQVLGLWSTETLVSFWATSYWKRDCAPAWEQSCLALTLFGASRCAQRQDRGLDWLQCNIYTPGTFHLYDSVNHSCLVSTPEAPDAEMEPLKGRVFTQGWPACQAVQLKRHAQMWRSCLPGWS